MVGGCPGPWETWPLQALPGGRSGVRGVQRHVQVARDLGGCRVRRSDPSSDFLSLAHHLLSVASVSVSHSVHLSRHPFCEITQGSKFLT